MVSNVDLGIERRTDGPVEKVDEGIVIAAVEGVGPAIEHMSEAGVERNTAVRVLTGPAYHRKVGSEAIARVQRFLEARLRVKKRQSL